YVAPLAIIQDIVAAQQALEGKPLPTTEIEPLIRRTLAEERRPAPMETFWPQLRKEEQQEYDTIATRISEQAHPPFMTLFIAPFVYFLGVHGSSLAFSLLSIGCLGMTLVLLCRGLQSSVTTSQKVLLSSVFLSWYSMFWVVRAGQLGALLGALVVIGWYCIRRDRPICGGLAVGVASSLKFFPALLLIYFLLRHRRAFLSGVGAIVLVNAVTIA